MRVQYERTPLSRRALCAHGEVDYEYEGGLTYDEFIGELEQRAQITCGQDCYDISWHNPTKRIYVYELIAEDSNEYFLTSPNSEPLTMRNVLEALTMPLDHAKLDWSEEEGDVIENILDASIETVPLHQLTIRS